MLTTVFAAGVLGWISQQGSPQPEPVRVRDSEDVGEESDSESAD